MLTPQGATHLKEAGGKRKEKSSFYQDVVSTFWHKYTIKIPHWKCGCRHRVTNPASVTSERFINVRRRVEFSCDSAGVSVCWLRLVMCSSRMGALYQLTCYTWETLKGFQGDFTFALFRPDAKKTAHTRLFQLNMWRWAGSPSCSTSFNPALETSFDPG